MARKSNRRKQTLIDIDLQSKVVFVALLSACLVLLINFQLTFASLWSTSATVASLQTVDEIVAQMKARTFREFLLSVGLGVPFATSLGILYSFKFCGPLFRIRRHLSNLRRGNWRTPCVLRNGDDLKEVAQMLNDSTSFVCEYADDTHDLLREVRAVLDDLAPLGDDALGERLSRIKERIAREEETYAKHFSAPVTEAEVSSSPVLAT